MYNLNIIGNGRVTLSLAKSIIDQRLDRYIKRITIWCREQKGLYFNDAAEKDTIRARYFLKANLKLMGLQANEISLSYVGPHNHSGFIPPETVKVESLLSSAIELLSDSSVNCSSNSMFSSDIWSLIHSNISLSG